MQKLPHAKPELASRYPGTNLSEDDKKRMAAWQIGVEELVNRPELIVYNVSDAIRSILAHVFTTAEQMLGRDKALAVAEAYGKEAGKLGYGSFLRGNNLKGGPQAMAMYQDLAHARRGYQHASALFAEYDDRTVRVTRTNCQYFSKERGTRDVYTEAIERGMLAGYIEIDPSLERIDNPTCLCKGSPQGCEHIFVFKARA